MKKLFIIPCLLVVVANSLTGQDLPLIYESDLSSSDALKQFEFTDDKAWRRGDTLGVAGLELFGKSDYEARVRSPFNIAVLRNVVVGDFDMEVDLLQTGREYGHRDMCLFFGLKDATNFYYVHLASKGDQNAHSIFLVNDEPRTNICEDRTEGISWEGGWKSVRIERRLATGTIKVYFENFDAPIMVTEDKHFDFGQIGFGSFDDTGVVSNIRIWGDKVEKNGIFNRTD